MGPLQKLARGDRQTHFGTFNFWIKPLLGGKTYIKGNFLVIFLIFWGLVPGFVSWVLGFVCWVLGFVCWGLGFVSWCLQNIKGPKRQFSLIV